MTIEVKRQPKMFSGWKAPGVKTKWIQTFDDFSGGEITSKRYYQFVTSDRANMYA